MPSSVVYTRFHGPGHGGVQVEVLVNLGPGEGLRVECPGQAGRYRGTRRRSLVRALHSARPRTWTRRRLASRRSMAAVDRLLDGLHLAGKLVELAVKGPCQSVYAQVLSHTKGTNLLRVVRRCVASTTHGCWSLVHRWHGWPGLALGLQRTLEVRQRVQAALRDMRMLRLTRSAMAALIQSCLHVVGVVKSRWRWRRLTMPQPCRLRTLRPQTPPITPSCRASPKDTPEIKCATPLHQTPSIAFLIYS